jgi:hypothetical protein
MDQTIAKEARQTAIGRERFGASRRLPNDQRSIVETALRRATIAGRIGAEKEPAASAEPLT